METNKPKVIAVCGKGGVGKTSVSALITRVLMEQKNKRILAIDADPAVGFATALGVQVGKTVDDIRLDVIESSREGNRDNTLSVVSKLDYEVFDAMIEKDKFAFLAIGRPETEGCYCKVNSYLRSIIESLASNFDYVIIDGEAGIEQVNRRVMEKITHLLLISDCSYKGTNVIKTIKEVAGSKVLQYERAGAIINRVKDLKELDMIDLGDIELLGCIVEDDMIRMSDIQDKSLLKLDEGPSTKVVKEALVNFGII